MKNKRPSGPQEKRKPVRFVSLFAGIGGFDLGLERAGMQCVGQVEIDKKCQAVLEKHWPGITRMGDILDVKGNEFGAVDLVCGGFPCQPFSQAGKRKGEADNRFLWPEMVRVIAAIRPSWVIGENVAGIVSMALDKVHSDLESIGYTVQSFIIPACAVGAIHRRDRVWIVAHSERMRESQPEGCEQNKRKRIINFCQNDYHTGDPGLQRGERGGAFHEQETPALGSTPELCEDVCDPSEQGFPNWSGGSVGQPFPLTEFERPSGREIERDFRGMAHGVSRRVDRLKQLGNAVVPQVVEVIGRAIMETERAASMPQEAGPKENIETCNTSCNT
jgi:DNA (cytosine-5)-methyltransferase 1